MESELEGWRCLSCGYAEVTQDDIEHYLVSFLARLRFRRIMHSVNVLEQRSQVKMQVQQSGIKLTSRSGWLRPCDECGSYYTARYRWILSPDASHFEPSTNNLPLQAAN